MDNATTWKLIHGERASVADTLEGLTPEQWGMPSLCAGWTVQIAAAHMLAAAEQSPGKFIRGMASNGFRFNTMIDRDAKRLGALAPQEIIERLRARTTTTNSPPGPVTAMLGEIVTHAEDIRRPLAIAATPEPQAIMACLDLDVAGNFPLGGKKRVAGLRLIATDLDWSHGTGPEVHGPAMLLLLAIAGRRAGLDGLSGDGLETLSARIAI
jgi:uncharacterized protein (TIGR03083 family)